MHNRVFRICHSLFLRTHINFYFDVDMTSAGWRVVGGKRNYYRSKWEANYARYLQYQLENEWVLRWDYEPHTFWFPVKRGCVSYLPDFHVEALTASGDYSPYWIEVKGYWDAKSLTKVKRFYKYYPNEKLRIIDGRWFANNNQKMRMIIKGWE